MSHEHASSSVPEMIDQLRRLIDAIDRRVPRRERVSESAIAREAADLRARALTMLRDLTADRRTPVEESASKSSASSRTP